MAAISHDWAGDIENFVTYCGRFAPAFPDAIVGASETDIENTQALAEIVFPPELKAFLSRMGRTPEDALNPFFANMLYGIEALHAFYAEPPIPVPTDAIYLCTLNEDSESFLEVVGQSGSRRVLHFEWPVDSATGEFLDYGRTEHSMAASLLHFLYENAFISLRNRLLPYRAELREQVEIAKPNEVQNQQRREEFRAIVEQLGFSPVTYIDRNPLAYDRGDTSLLLYSEEYAADIVKVRSQDEKELAHLCEILSDNLDMNIWR